MTTTPPDAERPRADDGPRVPPGQWRELGHVRRSRTDRQVAGVAGGLARHLDVDPLVLRVALAVLVFFGGAGLWIYGAAWVLVPEEGAARPPLGLDDRSRGIALTVVGGLATLAALGDVLGGSWWVPWPLVAVGLVVFLVVNRHPKAHPLLRQFSAQAPPTTQTPPTPPAPPQHAAAAPPAWSTYAPARGEPLPPPAAWTTPPRRDRGPILFWRTLALALLAVVVLGVLDVGGLDVAASAYPAVVLAVVGAALVLGAFRGRAGGLILVGLLAAGATAATTLVEQVGAGRIEARPTSAAQVEPTYEIFAGEIVLDLTDVEDLEALDGRRIDLEATFGRIEVLVPDSMNVELSTQVEGGRTVVDGDETDGSASARAGDQDGPTLLLDAEVTLGEIEVDLRSVS